jgi:exodeoxyribonuclease VIII
MSEINRRQWPCMCIDLETLATSADAVVLEIGAVMFDPATLELGPEYHAEVEMRAPDNRLRGIDAGTLVWWAERVKEGHDMPGMHGGISLWQALGGLAAWLAAVPRPESFEVWAWGSDFDFGILRHAHDEAQLALPWRYSRQCDARSFCDKLGIKRQGPVTHQALADAKQEAQAVMGALFKLAALEAGEVGEVFSVQFSGIGDCGPGSFSSSSLKTEH